jgi:3-hydroxyisobutyrate dehydrogenase
MADYSAIGFIGLGAMGAPMVGHLANKVPPETSIHVFDVVQSVAEDWVNQFPSKIHAEKNSKDVAEKSVRSICTIDSELK